MDYIRSMVCRLTPNRNTPGDPTQVRCLFCYLASNPSQNIIFLDFAFLRHLVYYPSAVSMSTVSALFRSWCAGHNSVPGRGQVCHGGLWFTWNDPRCNHPGTWPSRKYVLGPLPFCVRAVHLKLCLSNILWGILHPLLMGPRVDVVHDQPQSHLFRPAAHPGSLRSGKHFSSFTRLEFMPYTPHLQHHQRGRLSQRSMPVFRLPYMMHLRRCGTPQTWLTLRTIQRLSFDSQHCFFDSVHSLLFFNFLLPLLSLCVAVEFGTLSWTTRRCRMLQLSGPSASLNVRTTTVASVLPTPDNAFATSDPAGSHNL